MSNFFFFSNVSFADAHALIMNTKVVNINRLSREEALLKGTDHTASLAQQLSLT